MRSRSARGPSRLRTPNRREGASRCRAVLSAASPVRPSSVFRTSARPSRGSRSRPCPHRQSPWERLPSGRATSATLPSAVLLPSSGLPSSGLPSSRRSSSREPARGRDGVDACGRCPEVWGPQVRVAGVRRASNACGSRRTSVDREARRHDADGGGTQDPAVGHAGEDHAPRRGVVGACPRRRGRGYVPEVAGVAPAPRNRHASVPREHAEPRGVGDRPPRHPRDAGGHPGEAAPVHQRVRRAPAVGRCRHPECAGCPAPAVPHAGDAAAHVRRRMVNPLVSGPFRVRHAARRWRR